MTTEPRIINLTPHEINLVNLPCFCDNALECGHDSATFPSEGIARVEAKSELQTYFHTDTGAIPVHETSLGEVTGLPDEDYILFHDECGATQEDPDHCICDVDDIILAKDYKTVYIVSNMVVQASPERQDLYSPGEPVLDENGNTIGCKTLTRNTPSCPHTGK